MRLHHLLTAFLISPLMAVPALADTSQFDGQWASLSCEMRPQQGQKGLEPWYLKREIRISDGTIQAVFHSFADRDCAAPLFDLEFAGQFKDLADSPVAPGARQVDLVIDKSVKLTPLMAGFADFLNSGGPGSCGKETFAAGLQQEVRETGCAAIGLPANAVTSEFETMLVKGDALFFGARPIDGSSPNKAELRPTALQVPLYRQ
jgi:hypothetical protein